MAFKRKQTISIWDDKKASLEVMKRLKNAADARSPVESRWRYNEKMLFMTGRLASGSGLYAQIDTIFTAPDVDASSADMQVSYLFKNFRFIHAQMSANPPIVVMRPATSDQEDSRRADAADKIARYAMKHYLLQEKTDQQSLSTLLYGTGILKTVWDATSGEIADFDPETDEIELEGDISITIPAIWQIFLDPDARSIDEIKYVLEEVYIDFEEACLRWPDKAEALETAKVKSNEDVRNPAAGSSSAVGTGSFNVNSDKHYSSVRLIEYWETGLPSNGYLGRFCVVTPSGTVIESCRPNPFRFKSTGVVWDLEHDPDMSSDEKEARLEKIPERARLPYHFLTDIDVPNSVLGKSFVDYAAPLQDNLGKLDSAVLDAIQAHGIARLVIGDKDEVTQMGNSNWDVTKVASSAGTQPYFIGAPSLMPEMDRTRQALVQGLNDVCGVNESMMGVQSRETAATAMQYASNQGNMIRRRLFNKYVLVVEAIYRSILDLVRKHWSTSRTINVVGKERALEVVDIKGLDIDGGYEVVGDYGVSLSLDPTTRRQELAVLQPLFEKAGISARRSLQLMKLSELETAYDEIGLADTRQHEIFEQIIATGEYVAPKPFRDHENMIAYALRYFMTAEYNSLPQEIQDLCQQHVEARAALSAKEKTGGLAGQAPGAPPGPVPGQPATVPGAPGPVGSVPNNGIPTPAPQQ